MQNAEKRCSFNYGISAGRFDMCQRQILRCHAPYQGLCIKSHTTYHQTADLFSNSLHVSQSLYWRGQDQQRMVKCVILNFIENHILQNVPCIFDNMNYNIISETFWYKDEIFLQLTKHRTAMQHL